MRSSASSLILHTKLRTDTKNICEYCVNVFCAFSMGTDCKHDKFYSYKHKKQNHKRKIKRGEICFSVLCMRVHWHLCIYIYLSKCIICDFVYLTALDVHLVHKKTWIILQTSCCIIRDYFSLPYQKIFQMEVIYLNKLYSLGHFFSYTEPFTRKFVKLQVLYGTDMNQN